IGARGVWRSRGHGAATTSRIVGGLFRCRRNYWRGRGPAFSVALNTQQTKGGDMSTGQKKNSGQNRTPTRRTMANTVTNPEGLVSHYPLSSVLVVFGLGLAVGV